MTQPESEPEFSAKRAKLNPALQVVLPLAFLVIAYFALFFHKNQVASSHHPGNRALTPEESQRIAVQSKSLTDQGRYRDALEPTLTLYTSYPGNHIYIARLAEIYDHLGQYDQESAYWEKYLDHAPTPIEACPQIGQSYWKQGEKFQKQAIAAYQRCLAIDPKNTDSIFYLAHALEMSGEWAQAADLYRKGIALSPAYTDLKLGLARCWVRLDKPADAKKLADKILAKQPNNAEALLVLGMVYLHQENYVDARKMLARGAQLSDTDADFHILLARVAEHMNDDSEALRQYTRIAQLRPNDERARSRRDALLAANKK